MKRLIAELRRRNVIRTTTYYIGAAWVVIGACDILFPMINISDQALRVVILSALAGIPIIVGLSWFFDLSASGVTLDSAESKPEKTQHSALDLVLIAILAGALTVSVVINLRQGSLFIDTTTTPLIAVVPFDDLSEDSAHVSFGLAEELLTLLVRAPNMRVMSQATAFGLKDAGDIVSAASKLQADFIIRGSVRGQADEFRVIVRLIDVARGEVVWADDYSGALSEVFAAQLQVAEAVASSLDVAIDYAVSSEQGPLNAQAVDLYLQAKTTVKASGALDSVRKAKGAIETALSLQPNFVAAQSYLCRVHMMLFSRTEDADDFQRGETSCQSALKLDPDSPHTRLALSVLYNNAGRHEEAQAIALAVSQQLPNWEEAFNQLGESAWRLGDLAAAEQAFTIGTTLSPADYRPYLSLGNFYARNQMYDKALTPFGKIVDLMPEDFLGYASLGVTHYEMGNFEEAKSLTEKALGIDENSRGFFNLGLINVALDQPADAAEAFRNSLRLNPKNYRALMFLSQNLALAGDEDGARQASEKAILVIEELVTVNPNAAYALSNGATLLAQLGRTEEAIAWAERARAVNTTDPAKVQFNIGVTYFQAGQPERGIAELLTALDMGYPKDLFSKNEMDEAIFNHPEIQARLSENPDDGVASVP